MNSRTCKGNRFEKNWMDQWGKRGNSSLWNQYSSYRSFCVSHTPSVIHRTSLHFCSYPRCSYFFFCRSYDVPGAPDSSLSAESSSPPSTHTNCPLPELLLANDIHTQFTKLIMERQVSIEEGEAKAHDLNVMFIETSVNCQSSWPECYVYWNQCQLPRPALILR